MYKDFHSLTSLFIHIEEDKNWTGAGANLRNRYPIRFILFDDFFDFNEFIENLPESVFTHSIDTMVDLEYPDSIPTRTELEFEIRTYIKRKPANDFVIYPFSEITRFYDNSKSKEFEALVKTIRLIQPTEEAQLKNLRIYIPIVGMQSKMTQFINDPNTFVWDYKSEEKENRIYNLILVNNSSYNISESGLSNSYSVVKTFYDWLQLWKKREPVKQNIICLSKSIFTTSHYAQPDNAFTYIICNNAYEYLTKGLGFDFGSTDPCANDMGYWEELTSLIDSTFNFSIFINKRFGIYNLCTGDDFIRIWIKCESDFDRWLLSLYYKKISHNKGYIYNVISNCKISNKCELFSNIATFIFSKGINDNSSIEERRSAMQIAAENNIKITDEAENHIKAKLKAIASNPESGYYQAIKLFTPLTRSERNLLIEWYRDNKIKLNDIQNIYSPLYYYMLPMSVEVSDCNLWIIDYFNEYRKSKLSNKITPRIESLIIEKNGNPNSFQLWYENFKTVKTLLHDQNDIEVYCWIDGLGVDWIPFISNTIQRSSLEGIYLNEIFIGRSELPTITSVNKERLQSIPPIGMELYKIGDLDKYAHEHKDYPEYIIEEINLVSNIITNILNQYNGKKIAIISDHGLTYLSQFVSGLNIGGIQSEHEGRFAKFSSTVNDDNKYFILEDRKILCSLRHNALSTKVDKGHGVHGGCTPEEVLVPIFIISSRKNILEPVIKIHSDCIIANDPTIKFEITGGNHIDTPYLIYRGKEYQIKNISGNIYQSERLNIEKTSTEITIVIVIGEYKQNFTLRYSTGVVETDLFDNL